MLGYVIGDSNMITGFRLVGIEGAEVNSAEEAEQALDKALSRNDLSIIIISEEFSSQPALHEKIEKIRRERSSSLIVELPGSGSKGSMVRMSDLISKTLGVKI